MNMTSAKPLKTPSKPLNGMPTPTDEVPPAPGAAMSGTNVNPTDITSPHELTGFVETLLERLESKFDEMSGQILERMNQMSTRVDALETSIQDIINGDLAIGPSVPQSPSPGSGNIRRSGST